MDTDQTETLRQLTVVTPPDDTLIPAKRILLVNLKSEHTNMISSALLKSDNQDPVVVYVWSSGQGADWMLDKKIKSDVIVFDAESDDRLTTGLLAADPKAYYFGTLYEYSSLNPNKILDFEKLKKLL